MVDMRKRFTSRGYSILAALVFVALLGSITVAVNLATPSVNRMAMSALAPATGNVPTSAPASTGKESGQKQQCQPGYDYVVNKDSKGSPQVVSQPVCPPQGEAPKGPEQIKSTQQSAAASLALAPGTFGQQNDPVRCELDAKTKQYKPKSDYKCKVKYCIPVGGNKSECKEVDNLFGANSSIDPSAVEKELREPLIKDILKNTDPSEHQKLLGEMGVSSADQDILKKAYEEDRTETKAEIARNNNRLSEIEQALSNCAYGGCDEGRNARDAKLLEAEKAALDARNESLQKRLAVLSAAEQQHLKPGIVPGTDQPGVAQVCSTSGGCVGPDGKPVPKNTFPAPGPVAPQGPAGPDSPSPRSGGNPMGALGSLLQGLMKGLTGSGAGQGAPCASDPNAYQQQQQQYQMQMQQYNYQLQQYNYQQQQAATFGGAQPMAPVPPAACTPNADSNTCPAAPVQPTTGCTNGSWKPVTTQGSNGRQCTTNWQCTPSNAVTPTAELSCQPKVADVGMSVAISFSCANATGSSGAGGGFSTDNQTSGSTTTVIATPPAGATGITYALTCRNQNLTARAECSVQISKPTIVLLANPKNVVSGESSRVGWVTSGMQSCVVSSPQMPGFTTQNANNKNVNGVATTSPLTRNTTVVLTCQTIGGSTKAASTTIVVGNSTSTSVMAVSSTIDGRTDVKHGASTTITWQTPSAPSNSAVALWLVDSQSGQATGLIHRTTNTSGSYVWAIPATSSPCAVDSPSVCGADLIVGRTYSIQASLFTPPNAYLGGFPPANPITPTYLDEVFTATFKVSN